MASDNLSPDDLRRVTQLAKGWGKIVCRRAFGEQGPGPDVDLTQMEDLACAAARALLAGVLEEATQAQAERLGDSHPCPGCGRDCPVTVQERPVEARGGPFEHREPACHCPTCRRDFFPSAPPAGA
jgi:hypothetical protein